MPEINDNIPQREEIPDNSPEAQIQDLLTIAAPNGGAWLLGRHTFYTALMKGQPYDRAIEQAIDAASEGQPKRANQALDTYYGVRTDTAEPAPKKDKPGGGIMSNIRGAFASRQPS